MRWQFWKREPEFVPAPSGVCNHMWSNWSEPGECRVKATAAWGTSSEYDSWAQGRHCLNRNMYERRVA